MILQEEKFQLQFPSAIPIAEKKKIVVKNTVHSSRVSSHL